MKVTELCHCHKVLIDQNVEEIAKYQVLDGHKFVIIEYYYVSPTAQSEHSENAIKSGRSPLHYCHRHSFWPELLLPVRKGKFHSMR